MPIKKLSQSLINKIAAGEVIERPASVVKELMENAVDAGSTRIDVAVAQGGLEMVRVTDNGGGIPPDELPLALASHATSKLIDENDLFHVATLGFRGEALASIGEVSRMVLRSRTPTSDGGAELEIVGGKVGEVEPCGAPVGTTVEVHTLFFNTPVRKKFLRTTQTEFGHVAEAFTRIALALPNVHFTLRHNEKPVFELPAHDNLVERIAVFFGRELADQLIHVESEESGIRLSGYAAHPSQSRSHNRMQYFFLNGRHIRDRSLQHALGESYRGMMMVGRYPIAFLTLDMPPDLVDVNVHPTKLEVRFQDSGRLYSQLLAMLRNRFLTSDLDTRVHATPVAPECVYASSDDPAGGVDTARAEQLKQDLVSWAKGQVAAWDRDDLPGAEAAAQTTFLQNPPPPTRLPLDFCLLNRSAASPNVAGAYGRSGFQQAGVSAEENNAAAPPFSSEETSLSARQNDLPPSHATAMGGGSTVSEPSPTALQIHNRYLITESEEGVMVIDQHALHERILYEQLRERIEAGGMEMQSLLVPEPVDLSPAEAAAALENRELLAKLGLKIEPFGGDTVLISGYPAMLANLNPKEILHELVERLLAGGAQPQKRDILDELLHTIACKAAIKAGDRLAPDEIRSLLQLRHLVDDAHHCPHGRPTSLIFTRDELDRQFKRV